MLDKCANINRSEFGHFRIQRTWNHIITSSINRMQFVLKFNLNLILPEILIYLNYCLNSDFIFVLFWQKGKRQFFRFLFATQKPNQPLLYIEQKISYSLSLEVAKMLVVWFWSFRIHFSGQILTRLQTCACTGCTSTRDTLYLQIA